MTQLTYILSAYPLSAKFRAHLERHHEISGENLSLSQLRHLSPTGLLKHMHSLRASHLIVPLEEASTMMLLPILKLAATATRARRIEIILPDSRRTSYHRSQSAIEAIHLAWACAAGRLCVRSMRLRIERLLAAPRSKFQTQHPQRMLYLKTNLMLGVKAGGSVGHIAGVINALVASGTRVTYLSAEEPVGVSPHVEWCSAPLMRSFAVPFELNSYRYSNIIRREGMRIADRGFDVIYQRMSLGNIAGVELSRRQRIPLIIEYNGSEAWIAKHWGSPLRHHELAVAAEDVCLKHAHLVVTVSDVLRDELVSRGVEPERIVAYPNCIDPSVFDPDKYTGSRSEIRAALGLGNDALLLTFLGTFGPWHGTDILAAAIAKLAQTNLAMLRRRKTHFLLVGDGAKMARVRDLLAPVPPDLYSLPGLVEQHEAPRYLAASDILLSPHAPNEDGTRFFGSPTKLFEYMAMGKCIIASDLEQIGAILCPAIRADANSTRSLTNEIAITCVAGSVDSLMEAILLALERPEATNVLGRNARVECMKKYTWSHHIDAILARFKNS